MSAAAPEFKGFELRIGGVVHIVPKLSFGAFEDTKERMRQIAEGEISDPTELQGAFVDVLHAALLRNYPSLPRKAVADVLDWDTAPVLFQRLLAQSVPQAPAGEPTAGRASRSGASTGAARSRKSSR